MRAASSASRNVMCNVRSYVTTETQHSGCGGLAFRNAAVSAPPTMAVTVAMDKLDGGFASWRVGEVIDMGKHAWNGL